MVSDCKIVKEIARGGQKVVYLAQHPTHGMVVVKRGTIKSFSSLERIRREIQLLSEIESEYYPVQHHFNVDIKTNEFEIVEAYIEGQPLRECVGLFTEVKDIFNLLSSLVDGLTIIWERNIVHRDLKPENIIIRTNGKPCIIDLGIARFLDLESLTKTISPSGPCTPIYASPEQLTNNKNVIDHRTDFFALGIIALELYLRVHPCDPIYLKNHYSIVENIMLNNYLLATDTIPNNSAIEALAKKTLQSEPYKRFRTPHLFKTFLNNNLQNESISSNRVSP